MYCTYEFRTGTVDTFGILKVNIFDKNELLQKKKGPYQLGPYIRH